uniref:Uncharacterized protein n=1 Tax=Meloidogyne incognita TaxID=6306 RepID=A0A914N5I6_MELIC
MIIVWISRCSGMAFKRALCSLLSSSRIFLSSALRRAACLDLPLLGERISHKLVPPGQDHLPQGYRGNEPIYLVKNRLDLEYDLTENALRVFDLSSDYSD